MARRRLRRPLFLVSVLLPRGSLIAHMHMMLEDLQTCLITCLPSLYLNKHVMYCRLCPLHPHSGRLLQAGQVPSKPAFTKARRGARISLDEPGDNGAQPGGLCHRRHRLCKYIRQRTQEGHCLNMYWGKWRPPTKSTSRRAKICPFLQGPSSGAFRRFQRLCRTYTGVPGGEGLEETRGGDVRALWSVMVNVHLRFIPGPTFAPKSTRGIFYRHAIFAFGSA